MSELTVLTFMSQVLRGLGNSSDGCRSRSHQRSGSQDVSQVCGQTGEMKLVFNPIAFFQYLSIMGLSCDIDILSVHSKFISKKSGSQFIQKVSTIYVY